MSARLTRTLRRGWSRLLASVSGRRGERDLAEELDSHIGLLADENIRRGLPPDEAHRQAALQFGSVESAKESYRDQRGLPFLDQFRRDLRYALRLLSSSPAFTAAAVLTIAVGVGANTAVFSLVDAALLQLLPVQQPKQLVFLEPAGNAPPSGAAPYPCLTRLPAATNSFTGLAIFATDELRVEVDGKPEQVFGQVASGNYFELLGVKPAWGRLMTTQDEKLDPPVAVISDRYWQRRFGRDPSVLGKAITVLDQTFTVVGVSPPEFLGLQPGRPVDMTIPADTSRGLQTYSGPWWFDVIARLKPGVSVTQARAASNVSFPACMSGSEPLNAGGGTRLAQLDVQSAAHGVDALRSRFSKPLYALMGIVIFVLLLATVNIANLLLARGVSRSREFAIRLATGATRAHLVRQLLTETFLLFLFGAVPGVLLAGWGVTAVEALFAQGRRPITLEASLNWRILTFSILITLVAGLVSGLFPVWRALCTDPQNAIREGHARTSDSRSSTTLMGTLVGFQVALSLVLLIGAIAFVRTLTNLNHVNPGFRNEQVLTMSVELPEKYAQAGNSLGVWSRVLEAVRQTPGVRAAGLCSFTPLSGRDNRAQVQIRGFQPSTVEESTVRVNHVSEGYFETMGIQLLRGRLPADGDREDALRVVFLNESAARMYFGERDPIGQPIEFPRKGAASDVYRIAGIVQDTKHNSLREPSPRFAFLPIRQPRDAHRRLTLTVASEVPSGHTALTEPIRSRLADVDSSLLISEVITMRGQIDSTLLTERLLSGLSSVFGIVALILASVGLYGVLSYRIGQQRQSIGIRMALGASPSFVVLGVLRQSGRVIAIGLLCGLPVAFFAARTADSMLWGFKSSDPATYVAGIATLCLVGFVSAWIPARRASAIEPAETLRHS